jgi:hypothetical protein
MGKARKFGEVRRIIIHCSATPNGRFTTSEDIDAWHATRGFRRDLSLAPRWEPRLGHIGYHFVIYSTGSVRVGRPVREIGAHAEGHNADSIGICLVGTDAFSADQWQSLAALVRSLSETLAIPGRAVLGHRDLPGVAKTCPGFDVQTWLAAGLAPLSGHILPSHTEHRSSL